MKKISILSIILVFFLMIVSSCNKSQSHTHNYVDGVCSICGTTQTNTNYLDAKYVISSATLGDEDVTTDFTIYEVTFNTDFTMLVNIYKDGYLIKRESTYTRSGSIITEKYKNETYTYTIFSDQILTIYDDLGDEIEVILKLYEEVDENQAVDFESILFGTDMSQSKFYNYCPAIIYDEEDGQTIMHVWYCTNKDTGVIMDFIGYRKGTLTEDGKWQFSEEQIVLSPTEGTWDSRHTCDPSVVKGEFKYKGQTYSYLMAYLGCTTEDYQKNETGLAVASSPEGPWIKIDEVNPIVPWYDDGNYDTEQAKYESYQGTSTIYWGTGMPSLVSVDGKSEVIMFYASTYRGIGIRRLDLSDIEHPVVKYTTSITSKNIVNSQGSSCKISIPDFAYDATNKRFYVTGVTNEKNPADVTLTRVNSHSFLAYIDNVSSMEELSSMLESGKYEWTMVGYVGPNETGFERNHNPGIVKNAYGYIPDSSVIGVIVSTGHNSWGNENIFTYRLYGHLFYIEDDN